MTTHTPEILLALARACMPDENWVISAKVFHSDVIKFDPPISARLFVGYYVPDDDEWIEFDPLINPAHAWAVYKFWRDRADKALVFYGAKIYQRELDFEGASLEQANLAAAIAVLDRMKGDAK